VPGLFSGKQILYKSRRHFHSVVLVKYLPVSALAFMAISFLLLSGCAGNQSSAANRAGTIDPTPTSSVFPVNISSAPGTSVPPAINGSVSQKSFSDTALIRAKALSVQPQGAQLEILQVVSYAADPRDGTVKLADGEVRNFTFQWGTSPIMVDLPPLGVSSTDINLSGISVNSIIEANISISESRWTVYTYE